uniref:Uncharacterized protein n=1 Tax=Setaria italica TaxID=4555 RepID=K4APJ0_SETIT
MNASSVCSCANVEMLQFLFRGYTEPFEGIGLIIVSIFERKELALLASSFGNICSRRLFRQSVLF